MELVFKPLAITTLNRCPAIAEWNILHWGRMQPMVCKLCTLVYVVPRGHALESQDLGALVPNPT